MTFLRPERLLLLAVVAATTIGYAAVQVRRQRLARRYASAHLLPTVVPGRVGWWRHVVAMLFLAGLVLSTLGAAQPVVAGEREREHATIVVAIDTSDSMKAADVAPDRLTAAKVAAASFIDDLPSGFDVALVTAGAAPTVVVPPTTDHRSVIAALRALETGPGTALGDAIFTALGAIPTDADAATRGEGAARSARIVLLSDGVTTTGRPDREAIEAAAAARVPVSTIAFGTDDATVESQGITVEVPVDSSALEAIAEGTGGKFFEAATTAELASIYDQIEAEVRTEPTDVDVAEWFAGGALALVTLAVVVSITTTGRAAIA